MTKRLKIENRTRLFNAALKRLDELGKLPSNTELGKLLNIKSVSTISEIKGERQNIQPASWGKFKTEYSELVSELEEEVNYASNREETAYKIKGAADLDKILEIAKAFTDSLRDLSATMSNQSDVMKRQTIIIEKLAIKSESGNMSTPTVSM